MNWLNLCSGGEIGRQAVKELGLPVSNWFTCTATKPQQVNPKVYHETPPVTQETDGGLEPEKLDVCM